MQRFVLDKEEVASLQKLIAEIASRYDSAENPEFLLEVNTWAQEMPRRLRSTLNSFRLTEPDSAMLLVSGLPIDDEKIGPTPAHWNRPAAEHRSTLEEEIYFALVCSMLGEMIGWQTQQNGRIIHDVMPIKGMEQEQIGTGSEQLIWWHTEDAFHELHGDYIALMFLRNLDRVPTTFASLEGLELDPEDWETLFEPHYTILPDKSHRPENAAPLNGNGNNGHSLEELYHHIQEMQEKPPRIPILSGDRRSPYIQIDPYFMDPVLDNPKAQKAFEALCKALDARITDIALEPGDVCFIDNRKAVHGRRAFKARYDGHDRWFKRTNITRDLRKSRASRADAASRIIL